MNASEAAKKLGDNDKAVRDEAMAAILAAKQAAVPHLVEALGMPGAAVAKIALLLAALSSRDGLPKLYDLLDKGVLDLDTRAVVARALGELLDGRDAFDDGAKRCVMRLSRDAHVTTRQLSVKALEKIGDAECMERLREMSAADFDASTKKTAAAAYQAWKAQQAPESGGDGVDLEALVAAHARASGPGGSGAEAAPTGPYASIVVKLRDPRWAMRSQGVEEAVAGGKAVVPSLIEVLGGQRASAKIGASQALARLQSPDAAQALLDVALQPAGNDDERQLRPIALKALACSLTGGEEGMAQPLLPLTREADPFVRAGALLCLGRLSDRVGARAATLALTDPHDHVQEAAAVALSEGTREEDADLVLPLLAVLGGMPSPGTAVKEAILLALARITVTEAPTLLRLRHRVRRSVLGMTSSLRRTAITILEKCYADDDPPPVGVVDDVLGRLADDHPEVRLLAASFVSRFLEPGMTGAVEKLEDALDRAEGPVSLLCLEALKRHGTGKSKAALEAAAEDPDAAVAARAKELLDGYAPSLEEWAPTAAPPPTAPAVLESAPSTAPVVEAELVHPGEPLHPAPPAPEPPPRPTASPSGRVRRASTSGGGDVVEAKEAGGMTGQSQASTSVETSKSTLLDRLRAVDGLPESERAAARAKLLSEF